MKKRIAALLLSTVMAFSLTACGNSAKTEKADNKETKQTTEAVEDMSFDEMVGMQPRVQPLHFTDGAEMIA